MPNEINHGRRQFFGRAAAALAAAQLGLTGSAAAQTSKTGPASTSPATPATNASLGPLKQIDAGLLNVGYAESGPAQGPVVILLHGWPYDIDSFAEVAPVLAAAGYRVIVPYLRGYGTTRFLSDASFRNGQPSAIAVDMIALMDALKIDKAIVAGFDWGARTANIMAALWPERVSAMVSVSGYLIGNQQAGKMPLPPKAELEWWYQFYFATERGRLGYDKYRREFSKLIWQLGSPKWASTTPRSIAVRRRSTIRIMSRSSFTTTAGGLDWPKESRGTTNWKNGSPRARPSACRPSPWKAMPTARRIRIPPSTRKCSRASIRTEPSRAASGTICPRKRRGRLRRRSSTSRRKPDRGGCNRTTG